ncbi:hypothetical protein [Thiolapillus sp.]|uniref:hypothetical protein n=1 Tax=Thiolapillus sp. TaxID=2017437 RepID=UPI003AF8A5E6
MSNIINRARNWLARRLLYTALDYDDPIDYRIEDLMSHSDDVGRRVSSAVNTLYEAEKRYLTASRDELENFDTCTALEDSVLDAVDVLNVLRSYAREINK